MIRLIHFIFLILLVAADQISKGVIRTTLTGGKEVTLIPKVFKLVFHKNDGAVWGIMSGKTVFLAIITIVILLLMLWFYFRIPQERRFLLLQFIIVFVTAGALGNLLDRLFFGYVTDFLYFELIDFPVFNIADCYITVSAFLLVFLVLFYYKEEEIDSILSFRKKKRVESKSSKTEQSSGEEDTRDEE